MTAEAASVLGRLRALGVALAGWLVPGLGYGLIGRWGRAVGMFAAVSALALTGYLQRGYVFSYHVADPFSLLGFLADAGSGLYYWLAGWLQPAGPDIARASGDYGTRFLAAAGVLNVLAAFDAYALALGERE
jgi:hypothetical protein